jgi:hypothetical protein
MDRRLDGQKFFSGLEIKTKIQHTYHTGRAMSRTRNQTNEGAIISPYFQELHIKTGLPPVLHSTVCVAQSQACMTMFSFDLFFQNCAQGSVICIRFLFNHLPLPPDFFSRLYNSPRFFNSPQPSHSLPSLFTIQSTTIHISPASVGGMLNTVPLVWLLRDDRTYYIIPKAIYVH